MILPLTHSLKVDWDSVAGKANCKTGKYARDQFNAIRKLLSACAETNGIGGGDTPKSKPVKKAPASKRKKGMLQAPIAVCN